MGNKIVFIIFVLILVVSGNATLMAATTPLQSGECRNVEIDAANPWNYSGILLEQGEVYDFRVESIDEPWIDKNIPSTPGRGWTTWHRFVFWPFRFLARYPASNWYTLIGAIGEHFFFIGDAVRHTPAVSGELLTFANDKMNKYQNNKGRLTLSVCRE